MMKPKTYLLPLWLSFAAALFLMLPATPARAQTTPDKLPLIGPCPDDPRLYLATGHEGLGITTSLATGKLVADQLLHRTPAIPYEPYLPGRKQASHD